MSWRDGWWGARFLLGGCPSEKLQQPTLLLFLERHTELKSHGLTLLNAFAVDK